VTKSTFSATWEAFHLTETPDSFEPCGKSLRFRDFSQAQRKKLPGKEIGTLGQTGEANG